MGLFTKAVASKVADAPKKSKGVAWLAGDPQGDAVAKSVRELVRLDAEVKAAEAKMGVHKTVVKVFAENKFVQAHATDGVGPDTPMVIQTSDGEKVTYVVQDRGGQYNVKPEQKEALVQLLGPDALDDLLYDEVSFKFNRVIMSIPGVQDIVEKALEGAVKKLTTGPKPVLTTDQAELLIEADQKTAFKPNTLERLSAICGRSAARIKQFLDIMGSSATRYVKV